MVSLPHWDKIIAVGRYAHSYESLVIYRGKCSQCRRHVRCWRGINYQGIEDIRLNVIKPKHFETFQKLINNYKTNSSKGSLVVKAQKKHEGKALNAFILKEVIY